MDDLLAHFAAVRAPRGQEPCSCCDADGVHPGQACSRCEGTGFVRQGSDAPFCPGREGDEPAPPKRRHWREAAPRARTMPMADILGLKSGDFGGRVGDHLDDIREKLGEDEDGGDALRRRMRKGDQAGHLVVNRGKLDDGHRRVLIGHELGWPSMTVRSGTWVPRRWEHDPEGYELSKQEPDWEMLRQGREPRPMDQRGPQHEGARRDPWHGAGPWYHGTPEDLETGAVIQPGDVVGKQHMGRGSDSTRTWVTNDAWKAASYGTNVYEVEPSVRPKSMYARHHEHYLPDGGTATVLRQVPYQEATELSPEYQRGKKAMEKQIRQQRRQQHEAVLPMGKPEYGPEPKYDFAPRDWPDDKRDAHNQAMFDKRRQWKAGIKRGLSLGHLTAPEAKAHGYYFGGHETDDRNEPRWAQLPHDLYHVTTDEPSVRRGGLKTREELAQQTGGHGLGGGEDDTISFTTDRKMAHGILGALHEFHNVVNGKLTPKHMWDQAKAGHGADRPFHQDIAQYWDSKWKDGDELPRGLHNAIHGVQRDNTMGSSQEMIDKARGPGWHPAHDDEGWMSGHKPPQKMHAWWEKEMDPDQRRENAADFYKHFAVHRQYAGGAEDPMFFATDTKSFAAKDPAHFALLHVRPKPGAQGYPVSAMSEWRTGTGDAVDVHHAEHAGDLSKTGLCRQATQPYSMQHEGPDPGEGEGLHEIGSGKIWPKDFHERPWEYRLDADDESMAKVHGSRDWPSRKVWAYRALPSPHREVNTGDWVSTSRRYARQEGRTTSNSDDDYPVVKFQARAEHLRNEGNSLDEWSYTGPKINRALVHFSGGANHRGKGGRGKTDAMCYEHEPEEMFSAYEQVNRERREKRKADREARQREGAAGPAYPNPHTNGREWYHGSKASGDQLAGGLTPTRYDPEKEREFPVAHWNALLGIHFAAHHAMADRFARPGAGGLSRPEAWKGHETPSVVHARLDIRNPKVYRSEHDMDDEAYEHEYDQRKNHIDKHLDAAGDDAYDRFSSNTRGFEGDSRYRIPSDDYEEYDDFEGDDEDRPAPVPRRTLWLNAHPDKEGIANRFRQRLQAQGHDGIIYHNDFEHERVRSRGEHANKVAIAFDPAQVRVTKHHLLGQEGHTAALGKTADDDAGEHDDDGGQWDTCYHCQEEHDPQEHAGDPGFMPDWNRVVNNTPSIHRALGVVLPDREHAIVHDPKTRAGTAARIIAHHLATAYPEHGHTHWSAPEGLNEVRDSFGGYAAHHVSPEGEHGLHGPRVTEVVMHAQTPDRGDIEDNPHELISRQISPYRHPEYEIPLARGAPVHLTGMSWRKSHSPGWTEDHRYIPAQQDKWRNHSFAKPFRIEAVLPMPGMRNPHTGGDEWFHGTRAYPEELSEHGFSDPMEFSTEAFEQPDAEPQGHWNALLGTHFTADHDIAKEFALGEHSSGANSRGADPFRGEARHILHARLGLHNPKVYASEHDMDHEAYEHEHAAGNHPVNHVPQLGSDDPEDRYEAEEMWPGTHMLHQQYGARKIPAKAQLAGHPVRTNWLNSHPDRWGIADRYRKRLQDQGHDGIVYGNEYEHSKHGKNADKSAIVFDPARIQVTQRHHAYADHLSPEEGEHQQARMPGAGQQQLFSPRLGARDISKIRLKHEPPIVSGHWERDEQGAPSNWVDTDPAQGHHMLRALAPNNRTVGWMHWDKGVVRKIDVSDNWQRSGLGRRMWEHASEITPGLSHSDNRTEEGQGFAKAVGGPLPERVQDHPEWFRDAARRKPLQPDQHECWKCGVRDSKEKFTKASPYAPVMGLAMECTDKDACRARREARHTAAVFVPTERIFGPTYGLDHRLFDEHEQLRPGVRQALLGRLQGVLEPVLGPNWDAVTRVYLAGSEASRWTSPELVGNGDLDVLIGVAYSYARQEAPHLAGLTDVGIDKHLNAALQEHFNAPGWHPPFGPEDTYDLTGYVNHNALDIRAIKPYAAYDLTNGEWAVKPPDLPGWSAEQFPQGPALMQQARALIAEVRAILRLPEPFRTQEAGRIWDYIHEGRRLDFTEQGLGWQGTGNVLEKALDQASGGLVEKLKALKYGSADHAPAALGHGMTTADLGSAHA